MNIAIKICVPGTEVAHEWGDYHMALGLKRHFEQNGHGAKLSIMPEWYDGTDADCDVIIHLRGLNRLTVSPHHLNIMWNISHPELVGVDEYEDYDIVFVASEIYAQKLDSLLGTKVEPLLQCTDSELFYPDATPEFTADLLFVGNSRNIYRRILKDLLPGQYDLKVWGTRWEQFIDKKYIQGEYFPNERLRQLYSSCKILLNDHWNDMRDSGFISNRIFDALACKTFIISDEVAGLQNVLGDAVVTYRDARDLKEKTTYYLQHEAARREIAEKGYALVRKNHTFDRRVHEIIEYVEHLQGKGDTGKRLERGLEKTLRKKDEEIQYWKERYSQKEAELNMTITTFQQSLSWKITRPLRFMHRALFGKREKKNSS